MRAVCWHAPRDSRVEAVQVPTILKPRDALVPVTAHAICGSDRSLDRLVTLARCGYGTGNSSDRGFKSRPRY